MNLSQDFRQWVREAPNRQRVPAAIAGLALLGLLAWVFIPLATGDSNDSTDASAPADTVAVSNTPPSPAPKPADCTDPTGTVPGVTDSEIRVGVIIVNITGLATNDSLGVLPAATQKSAFQAVINSVNDDVVEKFRKLVPKNFNTNT